MKKILIMVVLVLLSPFVIADDDLNGGIVYGSDHAFGIVAPEGWILDNSSGRDQGLHAVFHPTGSSWAESSVVMYVNTAGKEPPHQTLDELVEFDLAKFRKHSPDVVITAVDSLHTSDKKEARVLKISGDQWGNYESIAYLEDETLFVLIVLSSRNRAEYESNQEAFRSLVGSYFFITSHVVLDGGEGTKTNIVEE